MSIAPSATSADVAASRWIDKLSPGGLAGVAAGALVVGGLIGASNVRADGSRRIRRERAPDYTLKPESKEAARESLQYQRHKGTAVAVGGTALLGYGALKGGGGGNSRAGMIIAGAGLIGWGAAQLFRLHGAEANVEQSGLPDRTAIGGPEMRRSNGPGSYWLSGETRDAHEGAGYDVYGWPTDTIDLSERFQPTLPNTGPSLLDRLNEQAARRQ